MPVLKKMQSERPATPTSILPLSEGGRRKARLLANRRFAFCRRLALSLPLIGGELEWGLLTQRE